MPKELDPYVTRMIKKQNEHCDVWDEKDTCESLDKRIIEEGIEMYHEVVKCMLGAPPEFLLSEIGDVLYLFEKRKYRYPDCQLSKDVDGVIHCAYYFCEITDTDPNVAVMMKWLRNDMKYLRSLGNNGFTPEQYEKLCKFMWPLRGGDYAFYEIWEQVGEEVYPGKRPTREQAGLTDKKD